jgi:uncharacterized protein
VKLVVDANTLISGALWAGPPARVISAGLRGDAQIFLSLPILLEVREVLQRAKFIERLAAKRAQADLFITGDNVKARKA